MKLITRSLRPLLFEIPNGITEEEMEYIKSSARDDKYNNGGMFMSRTGGGLTLQDHFKPSDFRVRIIC